MAGFGRMMKVRERLVLANISTLTDDGCILKLLFKGLAKWLEWLCLVAGSSVSSQTLNPNKCEEILWPHSLQMTYHHREEIDEKLINNIISYFSEKKITEEFKNLFLEELKKDEEFQEKLKAMVDVDEGTPGDEILWKKMIESDVNILSHEAREKLFKKFELHLQGIFQNTESSAG